MSLHPEEPKKMGAAQGVITLVLIVALIIFSIQLFLA